MLALVLALALVLVLILRLVLFVPKRHVTRVSPFSSMIITLLFKPLTGCVSLKLLN